MRKQVLALFLITLALIGGAAGLLLDLQAHQKLGLPGVKTHPLAGSNRLQVELPEKVLDYKSEWVEVDDVALGSLPSDTSFGQRRYTAPDGFAALINVVLMGTDRTSMHKPQFCLEGQGWRIDTGATLETSIPVERPFGYDLPVVKLLADKEAMIGGQERHARGIYVYWFVCDDTVSASASGFERMWLMAKKLIQTGVLQRWAYVSCFSVCAPGQEDSTYTRMQQLIAASVPEFQLTPRARVATATAP
jgi:hypothetical protein